MEWVVMSKRGLNRVEVLAHIDDDRLSADNASAGIPAVEAGVSSG
ncbi:hypothetical protein [Phaeobacter inhibens]|nr:hypothetical protein [Phaeobacter inhibens]AUQ68738.1 Integrase core domain protein [Phaeobacter inhibens]